MSHEPHFSDFITIRRLCFYRDNPEVLSVYSMNKFYVGVRLWYLACLLNHQQALRYPRNYSIHTSFLLLDFFEKHILHIVRNQHRANRREFRRINLLDFSAFALRDSAVSCVRDAIMELL